MVQPWILLFFSDNSMEQIWLSEQYGDVQQFVTERQFQLTASGVQLFSGR